MSALISMGVVVALSVVTYRRDHAEVYADNARWQRFTRADDALHCCSLSEPTTECAAPLTDLASLHRRLAQSRAEPRARTTTERVTAFLGIAVDVDDQRVVGLDDVEARLRACPLAWFASSDQDDVDSAYAAVRRAYEALPRDVVGADRPVRDRDRLAEELWTALEAGDRGRGLTVLVDALERDQRELPAWRAFHMKPTYRWYGARHSRFLENGIDTPVVIETVDACARDPRCEKRADALVAFAAGFGSTGECTRGPCHLIASALLSSDARVRAEAGAAFMSRCAAFSCGYRLPPTCEPERYGERHGWWDPDHRSATEWASADNPEPASKEGVALFEQRYREEAPDTLASRALASVLYDLWYFAKLDVEPKPALLRPGDVSPMLYEDGGYRWLAPRSPPAMIRDPAIVNQDRSWCSKAPR